MLWKTLIRKFVIICMKIFDSLLEGEKKFILIQSDIQFKLLSSLLKIDELSVFLPDLDPCLDVICHYHGLCKAFGPQDARCVCVDKCPSYHDPVCSSNGTTYDNQCLFEQEMCLHRLNFTIQHPGSCEGETSTSLINWQVTRQTRKLTKCSSLILEPHVQIRQHNLIHENFESF